MTDVENALPMAEAAEIDLEIGSAARSLFSGGAGRSGDLRRLQALIEKRAAGLSPAASRSVSRLRDAQAQLKRSEQELRASTAGLVRETA